MKEAKADPAAPYSGIKKKLSPTFRTIPKAEEILRIRKLPLAVSSVPKMKFMQIAKKPSISH